MQPPTVKSGLSTANTGLSTTKSWVPTAKPVLSMADSGVPMVKSGDRPVPPRGSTAKSRPSTMPPALPMAEILGLIPSSAWSRG